MHRSTAIVLLLLLLLVKLLIVIVLVLVHVPAYPRACIVAQEGSGGTRRHRGVVRVSRGRGRGDGHARSCCQLSGEEMVGELVTTTGKVAARMLARVEVVVTVLLLLEFLV